MPRTAENWFDDRFASQRSGLVKTASQHLSTQQSGLEAVGTWLDTEYSEQKVRAILEHRRQQYRLRDAGQPTPPDGRRIPGSGYRDPGLPGDGLRADRVEQAFTALHSQNRGGDLLRLLGQNIPHNERKTNALRAVVVSACIVDPDADEWLAPITPLASCPWQGDSTAVPPVKGRVDVDRRWGHEALRLLQEACSVLGWEPTGSSTPSTTTLGDGGESVAAEPVVEAVDRTSPGHAAKLQVVVSDDDQEPASKRNQQEQPTTKPPSDKAWQAWRLKKLVGITNQTDIAHKMTKEGVPCDQGTVSRWLTHVDEWLAAGGKQPPMPGPMKPAVPIDPAIIDQGERTDHRTKHQRSGQD